MFWVNAGPEWQRYDSLREGLEVAGLSTVLQWLLAVLALKVLVPVFLNKERLLAFATALLLLAFVAAQCYVMVSYLYLEPTYPNSYGAFYIKHLSEYSLVQRLGFSELIKYLVLGKVPMLLFPAAILIAANFYQKQKALLVLREQKQAAELTALKNQLNPHFIFNTLNNIYALAISGSERTAVAVEKLSGILDYVLYQGQESLVSVADEVTLINNYIALETLRFGDRVHIEFTHDITRPAQVAPLLYLSLIENAFKHGVSQSLGQANVKIALSTTPEAIVFKVSNSKPPALNDDTAHAPIGNENLKKQLALLYPGTHTLRFENAADSHHVELTLQDVHHV